MAAGTMESIELVADFGHQVTGVSVSETGRILVNFPRWTEDSAISVAELKDGELKPYPDEAWNAWRNAKKDALTPHDHWVYVQSVVAQGPKLVKIGRCACWTGIRPRR